MGKTISLPLVSVVLPVYNGEKYIQAAIDSILAQSYEHFELIIIDDGSTDNTAAIIASFKDSRLKPMIQKNTGVSAARNKGIRVSRGDLIAMHDADDISHPNRFKLQVNFFKRNSAIGLVGTNIELIDSVGNFMYNSDLLTHPDDLKLAEIFSNQIAQGSVMIRRKVLDLTGLYDENMTHSEDTDLWRRVARVTKIANIKEPLYKYRVHEAGAAQDYDKIHKAALKTTYREFDYYVRHKSEYRFFSFHPKSMLGGWKSYMKRKGHMYSLMSLLYSKKGKRFHALIILFISFAHYPFSKRQYFQLWATIKHGRMADFYYELF